MIHEFFFHFKCDIFADLDICKSLYIFDAIRFNDVIFSLNIAYVYQFMGKILNKITFTSMIDNMKSIAILHDFTQKIKYDLVENIYNSFFISFE